MENTDFAKRYLVTYTDGSPPGSTNWNPITLVAPGVNVKSTYINNAYVTMSGSSASAPHVAGGVALIKQGHPNFTAAQVKALLQSSATDLGPVGFDITNGAGLLNCEKAIV